MLGVMALSKIGEPHETIIAVEESALVMSPSFEEAPAGDTRFSNSQCLHYTAPYRLRTLIGARLSSDPAEACLSFVPRDGAGAPRR
jgi:hypothetical protein